LNFPSPSEPLNTHGQLSDQTPDQSRQLKLGLQLFAAAAERAGSRQLQLTLPPRANLADLRRCLLTDFPTLGQLAHLSRWAVDCEFVDEDYVFEQDQNVAMIPPVSGG
jgi:molybdopterin converting factor small subunit